MSACTTLEMLATAHAEQLARLGIPATMLEAAGVRSVSDAEAREMHGLNGHRGADLGGILFPYLSPLTGERVGARIRLDHLLPEGGGKYMSEPRCRHFFFPPGVADFLQDVNVQVVIVESEKSALALHALSDRRAGMKLLVIAIGGCWGWRRKIGIRPLPDGGSESETGPSPDFDMIVWQGRSTIVGFDSNATKNPNVQKARRALTKELSQRGARVLIAEVPALEGVNGPDDLIALHGDEAMLNLLDSATAERDVITLERGKLPDAVDQAEELLIDHSERLGIFQRAGELVRVISLPERRRGGGLQRSGGTVQLVPLGDLALTEVFSRIARWERIDSRAMSRLWTARQKLRPFIFRALGPGVFRFWRESFRRRYCEKMARFFRSRATIKKVDCFSFRTKIGLPSTTGLHVRTPKLLSRLLSLRFRNSRLLQRKTLLCTSLPF